MNTKTCNKCGAELMPDENGTCMDCIHGVGEADMYDDSWGDHNPNYDY